MLRIVGGIVIGLLAGIIAMMVVALAGMFLFPSGVIMDPTDSEQISEAFGGMALGAQFYVVLSWAVGALAGAAVAKRIVGRPWSAWFIAALFAFYVLLNTFILPMPPWLQATAVIAPLLGGLIANHLVANRIVIEIDDDEEPVSDA
jgi:hypothetical protein